MEKENKVMDHWKLCDSWELRFVFVQQTDQECIIVSICCRVLLSPRVSFFFLSPHLLPPFLPPPFIYLWEFIGGHIMDKLFTTNNNGRYW